MSTLSTLRERVCAANQALVGHGLVTFTWGNVSGVDREAGIMLIKPSGVAYDDLTPERMVPVRLDDGEVLDDRLRPSSDTPTHLALYRRYPDLGGVVHTHSSMATAWAQAGRAIPALGTTHADYFHGAIPCSRALTKAEIDGDYELNTGHVIIETLGDSPPLTVPGILVREHAPFAWGADPEAAVHNAVVIEEVAKMAMHTLLLNPDCGPIQQVLLDKHYLRKHGKGAYYGQPGSSTG